MAEDKDWDLYAIVRSCTSSNRNSESPFECLASLTFDDDDEEEFNQFSFPNLANQPRNDNFLQELQDSYKPFLPSFTTSGFQGNNNGNLPSSSISDFGVIFSGQNQPQLAQLAKPPPPPPPPVAAASTSVAISPRFNNSQQQQSQRRQLHQQGTSTSSLFPLRTTQSQTPRSRKKKSNQKRLILHVTAENLSNDVWAWRKYGQKPIKGSPYPRNYYRCSSSKGCAARKQVERSNTDPNMFIVSYTGDHTHPRPTHRNSLAGSTRNKVQLPPVDQKPEEKESAQSNISADKGLCSSPLSATSLSPRTPLSAPIDHIEAVGNEQESMIKTENLEGVGHDIDDGDCDYDINDDYDDDLLIPNMALNEDLIKGFQELISSGSEGGGGGAGVGGLSNSPAFGDNFSSSVVGGSAGTAAGATRGGG